MDVVEQCTDKDPDRPLAGYQPATDVYEHSKMDLDVYQIGVLLYMGAYDAAKEVFRYGGNSRYEDEDGYEVYRNLHWFASDDRSQTSQYSKFVDYYDGDENYAETIMGQALDNYSLDDEGAGGLSVFVSKMLAGMVMYMHSLHMMYLAVDSCDADDDNDEDSEASVNWDMGASYLIGSL